MRVCSERASGGRQPPVPSGSGQGADAPRSPGTDLLKQILNCRVAPIAWALLSSWLLGLAGCLPRPATGGSAAAAVASERTAGERAAEVPSRSPEVAPSLRRGPAAAAPTTPTVGPSPIRFHEITASCGITFVHCSGNDAEKEFPTCLGSGAALLDYDGDGWLDVYLATTRNLPFEAADRSQGNRLYRNRHDGTFEDVTGRAGVGFRGFCHGVTVADVDNDGRPDLYLTNLGPNVLYLNNADGTFRNATAGSGLAGSGWSCGAAFLDYDNDGRIDVYVSHYGIWSPDVPRPYCGDRRRGLRTICSPTLVQPERHTLYRNRGDGTFEDATSKAGVARRDGRGLCVIAADLNRDGRIDLYVANDKGPNFLFLNRGDGTFEDATESSGAASNAAGEYQGSMGVDAQDLDGDGRPEMVVTNFYGDGAALYQNCGGGSFVDVASSAGIIRDSKPYVGWGVAMEDFDNDGRPDLLIVNGHVDDNLEKFGQDIPYAEPAKVWWNRGAGGSRIALTTLADPGPFFAVPHAARGAAFGDIDNDGDVDVVISRMDQLPAVLLNDSPPRSWIRFELIGRRSNRSAIGAAIEVRAGGRVFHRQVKGGGSYLSANDPRVLVGLGDIERVDSVEVRWPFGVRSSLRDPAIHRTHVIREPDAAGGSAGSGAVAPGAGPAEGRRS
jgi:enediyne biosynthesis protein E4